MKETIKAIAFFALGLLFYSKLLDKPEVQNVIKRLKMKKGSDNIMNVSQTETSSDVITINTSPKEARTIKKKWRQLRKQSK